MQLTKQILADIKAKVEYLANEVVYLAATPGKELDDAKYALWCMADVLAEYTIPTRLQAPVVSLRDFILFRSGHAR